jgi:UMF1 family MFS transporter
MQPADNPPTDNVPAASPPAASLPMSPPAASLPAPQPTLRAVGGWVVYDLANTIYSMGILSLYLPLWVVDIMGGSDVHYSYATSIAMLTVFVLSPLLGALTDQAPRRKPFLVVSTLICISFTLLFGQGGVMTTLIFFVIANIAYLAGQQFYDALLPTVSNEHNRGRIGGIGVAVGYFGSIVAIVLGLLITSGVDALPQAEQAARYVLVFQAIGVAFLLFALPCFLFVREAPHSDRRFSLASVRAAAGQVYETFREAKRYPGLRRFLLGRFFYTDAINTVILFMGIYVTAEIGFSNEQAQYVLLIAVLFAIVGGALFAFIVDPLGPKRTLNIVLFIWMGVFALAAALGFFALPGWIFWIAAALAGIAMGGTWTADRPYMLRLTPPSRVGEFYGLYGMIGRFSAITGPLLWGQIVDTLGLGRPFAITTLLIGVIIAYVIVQGVSDEPRDWSVLENQGQAEQG